MNDDKAKAFIDEVMKSPEKKAQIDAFGKPKDETQWQQTMTEKILPIAKDMGFDLSLADFKPAYNGEVGDDELDAVAGGTGLCDCYLAGGGGGQEEGEDSGETYGCACVGYGQGGDCDNVNDNCLCVIGGVGSDGSS